MSRQRRSNRKRRLSIVDALNFTTPHITTTSLSAQKTKKKHRLAIEVDKEHTHAHIRALIRQHPTALLYERVLSNPKKIVPTFYKDNNSDAAADVRAVWAYKGWAVGYDETCNELYIEKEKDDAFIPY